MGELVFYKDPNWNVPAVVLPGAEKWTIIDRVLVKKGLVANLCGQEMMFLDTMNYWRNIVGLYPDTAAKSHLCVVATTHRRFYSFIPQLSRIRSLDGLHLLQPIQMSDLNLQPHEDMLSEMSRLQTLEGQTLESWESELAMS
ncbi:hypothetical protein V8E54_011940 [Elaphomyces granulatus]|jgi:hypothetical protein